MFAGASMEKVNLMKPPKQERSMSIMKRLRDYISSNGKFQLSRCLLRIIYLSWVISLFIAPSPLLFNFHTSSGFRVILGLSCVIGGADVLKEWSSYAH